MASFSLITVYVCSIPSSQSSPCLDFNHQLHFPIHLILVIALFLSFTLGYLLGRDRGGRIIIKDSFINKNGVQHVTIHISEESKLGIREDSGYTKEVLFIRSENFEVEEQYIKRSRNPIDKEKLTPLKQMFQAQHKMGIYKRSKTYRIFVISNKSIRCSTSIAPNILQIFWQRQKRSKRKQISSRTNFGMVLAMSSQNKIKWLLVKNTEIHHTLLSKSLFNMK